VRACVCVCVCVCVHVQLQQILLINGLNNGILILGYLVEDQVILVVYLKCFVLPLPSLVTH